MRVLITGGSGFIGSRISYYLLKKKFKVICLVNKKRINLKNKNLEKLYISNIIKNSYSKNIDAIIHCASKTPVNCNNDKKIFVENLDLMKKLLNFAEVKNVKNFIFLSSMSVYGSKNVKIYKENNNFNKPDIYGKSKRLCEKMLINYDKQKSKAEFKFISIRLPGVVGLNSHSNFISDSVKKILTNKRITVSNPDTFFNNIVYVNSLVNFIIKFIKTKKSKINVINLGSSNKMKIKEIFDFIYIKLKKENKVDWIKTNKNPFIIDFKKALKIGYKPMTVKNSLSKYLSEIKKRKFII